MHRSQLPHYQFTNAGYKAVQAEYETLKAKRPAAVEELRRAREMGDLSENGAYKAARATLSSLDSRLRHLAILLKYGNIIEKNDTGTVSFGCKVTVDDGKTQRVFEIVGAQEADPMAGKLSEVSPIGKALMGKRVNESVDITIPAGTVHYTIIAIE